jgi:hypothetical protein
MQRNLARNLLKINSIRKGIQWNSLRSLATVNEIFQNKSEFPTRHIGPRKTDVVSMLDLIGFKVRSEVFSTQLVTNKFPTSFNNFLLVT